MSPCTAPAPALTATILRPARPSPCSCDQKGKGMSKDSWCADNYKDECAAPPNNAKGEARDLSVCLSVCARLSVCHTIDA